MTARRALASVAGLTVAAMGAVGAQSSQPASARKVALAGGRLLDRWDVPPLHHAAVLIEGDGIVRVGRAAEVRIPATTPKARGLHLLHST